MRILHARVEASWPCKRARVETFAVLRCLYVAHALVAQDVTEIIALRARKGGARWGRCACRSVCLRSGSSHLQRRSTCAGRRRSARHRLITKGRASASPLPYKVALPRMHCLGCICCRGVADFTWYNAGMLDEWSAQCGTSRLPRARTRTQARSCVGARVRVRVAPRMPSVQCSIRASLHSLRSGAYWACVADAGRAAPVEASPISKGATLARIATGLQ